MSRVVVGLGGELDRDSLFGTSGLFSCRVLEEPLVGGGQGRLSDAAGPEVTGTDHVSLHGVDGGSGLQTEPAEQP